MASKRRYFVHLPNEKKLELTAQPKSVGKQVVAHVIEYFDIKEKEYFGINYESSSGHYAWLQDDKKLQDHDVLKTSRREFYFAFKFFVESVAYFKHCLTIELLYLHLNSLIYKGFLEVKGDTVFQLAAYALQINFGDYEEDSFALENLHQLALLPEYILQKHPINHCENCIVKLYKELKGYGKGKAILRYIMLIEAVPAYGVHFYKVKDKSGKPLWLGLSFKGVFIFELNNRSHPIKTYYWRQIENLSFRDKKFSIEVVDWLQRRGSADAKRLFTLDSKNKSSGQVKTFSWYGNTALIKSIWQMSIAQHKFFLDNQKKVNVITSFYQFVLEGDNERDLCGLESSCHLSITHVEAKSKDFSSLTNLANDLTNNNNTLIKSRKGPTNMTLIKSVSDKPQNEVEDTKETAELLAAKQAMTKALEVRRSELEDKLYDKVQELKKLCLQEADMIGKYPPEYVRYMDYNEKLPKIKKRVGAEFKVKLRNKEGSTIEREFPNSITASSSSSGISSSGLEPSDELVQLEQEFDILTQIANAAKKLATDSSAKGRTKKKRWKSFKKTVDKLQAVEVKMNSLREKVGQLPSIRASMLITEEDELMFEDGKISLGGGTESERSSLSEGLNLRPPAPETNALPLDQLAGLILGDNTSLSSADMLNNSPSQLGSEEIIRKRISSSDMDISKSTEKRSLTPPPSFERSTYVDSSSGTLKKNLDETSLIPSPRSSSGVSMDSTSTSTNSKISPRNWYQPQRTSSRPKHSQAWKESSLDSIDTASTASRRSEDTNSIASAEYDLRNKSEITSRYVIPLESSAIFENMEQTPVYSETTERLLIEELKQSERNQKNYKKSKSKHLLNQEEVVDGIQENFNKIQITISSSDVISSNQHLENDVNLPTRNSSDFLKPYRQRKRSSSFTETSSSISSRSESPISKNGTLKSSSQPQYLTELPNTYNVQDAFSSTSYAEELGHPGPITKSRSSQELQPPKSDSIPQTNPNQPPHQDLTHTRSGSWLYGSQGAKTPLRAVDMGPAPNPTHTGYRMDQPPSYSTHSLNRSHQKTSNSRDVVSQPTSLVSTNSPHQTEEPPIMTNAQRDMLNNEVYQDIGMGWVPSINDYSSRASVCESASIHSRREDILSLLRDHLSAKPRGTIDRNNQKRLRKMREQYKVIQEQDSTLSRVQSSSYDKTWASYQKQPVYSGLNEHQHSTSGGMLHSRGQSIDSKRSPSFPRTSPLGGKIELGYVPPNHQVSSNQLPINPRTVAAFQDPRLVNTVQNPRLLTNSNNAHAGWHGNCDLNVKQQILLRHYLHHARAADPTDHVRTNHVTSSTNQKHHVHASTNQQPAIKRQPNIDCVDQISPSFSAPSSRHLQQPQTHCWMSQQSEMGHAEKPSKQHGFQELSSTPFEDAESMNQLYNDPWILQNSAQDEEKKIPTSVAKQSFLHLPKRGVFSSAKSAPGTPCSEVMGTPFIDSAEEHGFSRGRDTLKQDYPSQRGKNLGENPYLNPYLYSARAIPRTPSVDRISTASSTHSTENGPTQQHPGHRKSPSFHHTQSSPILSLQRSRNPPSDRCISSPRPGISSKSTFQPAVAPFYIESIPMTPTKSAHHSISMHKSCSSPVITAASGGGGTLPRALTSKKRLNPEFVPESTPIFTQPQWTSMEQGLDRRSSIISISQAPSTKPRLHSTSQIPDSKAAYPSPGSVCSTIRIRHSRSRSEAWSNHHPAHPASIPLDSSRLILRGSSPKPLYHQPLQEGPYPNATNSLGRVKKQSASAENLWSPPKEEPAGTLV